MFFIHIHYANSVFLIKFRILILYSIFLTSIPIIYIAASFSIISIRFLLLLLDVKIIIQWIQYRIASAGGSCQESGRGAASSCPIAGCTGGAFCYHRHYQTRHGEGATAGGV
jgi:hypothetical protein